MASTRSPDTLLRLFKSETVVDLPRIEKALGGVCTMTAFRYLRQVPYRRSYNHNGRYYCYHEPSRYDALGLWTWRDVHFSRDGSLRKTVCRLVRERPPGATQRELQERLKVRVHNTLLDLLRHGEVARERLLEVYVYTSTLIRRSARRKSSTDKRYSRLNPPRGQRTGSVIRW